MRFLMLFGSPLDMTSKKNLNDTSKSGVRYNDITDRPGDQRKYIGDFQLQVVDLIEEFNE